MFGLTSNAPMHIPGNSGRQYFENLLLSIQYFPQTILWSEEVDKFFHTPPSLYILSLRTRNISATSFHCYTMVCFDYYTYIYFTSYINKHHLYTYTPRYISDQTTQPYYFSNRTYSTAIITPSRTFFHVFEYYIQSIPS